MRDRSSRKPKTTDPTDYKSVMKKIRDVDDFEPEVKVVLYGPPGTGKTTIAGTFPKPALLIDCSEKGTDSVRDEKGLKVIRVTEWSELEMLYWYLKDNPDKLKSVIVDTVSYAQQMAVRAVLEANGKDSKQAGGWGTMRKQDWGTVASMVNPWIVDMRDLPLNLAFIAHDRVFNGGDEDDDAEGIKPTVGPRLMPSIASTLNAAVGLIGNTFIRETFVAKEVKVDGKTKTKQVRKVEYCLRVGPHSYYITKVRKPKSIKAPDAIVDAEYDDILELISGKD